MNILFDLKNFHGDGNVMRRRYDTRTDLPDESRLVFIDVETTGLHTSLGAGIIEICLYDASSGFLSSMVDPGRSIPAQITEINGIDRDMIAGAPMFTALAQSVLDKLAGKIVVGHNVEFDLKFLYSELIQAGNTPLPIEYICTCKSDQLKYGTGGNRLYESLARRGVHIAQAHRAEDDVNMVRQLLALQVSENMPLFKSTFDLPAYRRLLEREPTPMFPVPPKKKTTHSLKAFQGWGEQSDVKTIDTFNRLIEGFCEDRVLDSREVESLAALGISKRAAQEELKKALRCLAADYYEDGNISWHEFTDLEDIAKLFGFNNSVFFGVIKEIIPTLKVVCFTNDLVVGGQVVDRYETLFPWAIENGFLPSTTLTKKSDLLINCGDRGSTTGKIEKALSYGVPICHISDLTTIE